MDPEALQKLLHFYQQKLADATLEIGQLTVANAALTRQVADAAEGPAPAAAE